VKLSYSWLSEFLPTTLSPEEMSEILTAVGLEVEDMYTQESIPGGLEGVVIGKVLSCAKHSNADKLKVTTVDLGQEEPVQIVCGAPNVAEGQTVVVATVGCSLHPIKGEPFKIKKAKIRGEQSFGMICAEDEIGLGESHDGIMVIEQDVAPGTAAAEYFKLAPGEIIYDIGLTPNRMDAMSHMGAAKDVAAYLSNKKGTLVPMTLKPVSMPGKKASLDIKVTIGDEEKCPRYAGICIANVVIKDSPEWLQLKLNSIGIRPINNVVDITNFVLKEMGQPLHALDYDKIKGSEVVIKTLDDKSKFVTLDEEERELSNEDLMICNAEDGMCMAGVFGGLGSGVSSETKNIFLESAFFEASGIRKSSVRHQLRTDAAARYEKGADISLVLPALHRAAQLISEIAEGDIASEVIDIYPSPKEKQKIKVDVQKLSAIAGKEYSMSQVKNILSALCFEIEAEKDSTLELSVPFAKPDMTMSADILEEIMRIDGLDNIPFTGKIEYSIGKNDQTFGLSSKEEMARLLVGKGFYEIFTNSITNSAFYPEREDTVGMLNNLSAELNIMRPSMLESAMQSIAYNLNRKNEDLKFFEFGRTYLKKEGTYLEKEQLCLYACGNISEICWSRGDHEVDLYFIKGLIQNLFDGKKIQFLDDESIKLQGKVVGKMTSVSPEKRKQFGIKKEVWFVDLDWNAIEAVLRQSKTRYKAISKFPGTSRDLSLVIDKGIQYNQVEKAVRKAASNKMTNMFIFDIYEGDKISADKKSYAVRLDFSDSQQTITDEVVDADITKIIASLQKDVGAEVRN